MQVEIYTYHCAWFPFPGHIVAICYTFREVAIPINKNYPTLKRSDKSLQTSNKDIGRNYDPVCIYEGGSSLGHEPRVPQRALRRDGGRGGLLSRTVTDQARKTISGWTCDLLAQLTTFFSCNSQVMTDCGRYRWYCGPCDVYSTPLSTTASAQEILAETWRRWIRGPVGQLLHIQQGLHLNECEHEVVFDRPARCHQFRSELCFNVVVRRGGQWWVFVNCCLFGFF